MNRNAMNQKGFTLIELLIVLAILASVVGLVAPKILGQSEKGKHDLAKSKIGMLESAIMSYHLDNGKYPKKLQDLVQNPSGKSAWSGPYVKKDLLKDPWDKEFVYQYPGRNGDFDIVSYGADGQQGGEGVQADVTNW